MPSETPILELSMAVAEPGAGMPVGPPLTLQLMPGECALVEVTEFVLPDAFADLCSGLVSLQSGHARFLGRDWNESPSEYAAALRGRIGRVFTTGAWLRFLDMEANILLPMLYHTRREYDELRDEALTLAQEFGLPGLPLGSPGDLAPDDLSRAALVRAFLGEPLLLLVEDRPQLSLFRLPAVLNRIAAACDRGAAVVWLIRERSVDRGTLFPATQRLRLSEHGLTSMRQAA